MEKSYEYCEWCGEVAFDDEEGICQECGSCVNRDIQRERDWYAWGDYQHDLEMEEDYE